MKSLLVSLSLILLLAPGCWGDDGTPMADAGPGADASSDPSPDSQVGSDALLRPGYALRVTGGHGGGRFTAGETVHVFADLDPSSELLVRWQGDVALLAEPEEWHTTLVMPARDVALTAVIEPRPQELIDEPFEGSTTVEKTLRYAIPAAPRGLILMHHGTGGSSLLMLKEEIRYFTAVALERGFAVVASDSEETAAKRDLDGNGKLRWDGGALDSVDFANQDLLVAALRARFPAKLGHVPLFAVGMSNGGSFSVSLGAVAASPAAASLPNLRFAAAVSYCASGLGEMVALTTTPTAWLMCGQQSSLEPNDKAKLYSAELTARGVPTIFDVHQPSPLYDARLARVDGVDGPTSAAIVAELRAAGWVDGAGLLTAPPSELAESLFADPAPFPLLDGLGGLTKLAVEGQLKVSYAAHTFFSDWAVRTIRFLEQHL